MEQRITVDWHSSLAGVDWNELSEMYRLAPLGDKSPEWLQTAFSNSMLRCFGDHNNKIIASGRAVADGVDCAYLCDMAVHPGCQGSGLGKTVIQRLVGQSQGHRKIILYAVPGRESFYQQFGFKRMRTAMAIFENPEHAAHNGLINFLEENMNDDLQDFKQFMKQREDALQVFVEGDAGPLGKIATHTSPASIFGLQGDYVVGADEVNAVNERGAENFATGSKNYFDILHMAARDGVAYWAGIQRSTVQMRGKQKGSRWTCASPKYFAVKKTCGNSSIVMPTC